MINKPVKIVHYLWSAEIGGIQRLVLDLATFQQQDAGLRVTVLLGKGQGRLIHQFEERGCNIAIVGLKSGYSFSCFKLWWLVNIFRQFDLIHLHSIHPLVCLAAALSKKKILFSEHGTFGVGRKLTILDRFKNLLKKVFLNTGVDFITFNSAYTQRTAMKLYGLKKTLQAIVYNGTTLADFTNDLGGVDSLIMEKCRGKFVIGTLSRLTERKRLDRLIEAFTVFEKGKDTVLLLVGDGPLRSQLVSKVTHKGLDSRVIFTGYQTNTTIYQNLMDVCVFPAEKEPFGLVAIEALALGKPAIVFNDGEGLVEIINPLNPDDVVNDIYGLSKRLVYYYSNKNEILRESEKRKNYVQRFSIDRMSEEVYEIYKKLL
jgi:glycosyltransferase involved in cell wall biosynthesis